MVKLINRRGKQSYNVSLIVLLEILVGILKLVISPSFFLLSSLFQLLDQPYIFLFYEKLNDDKFKYFMHDNQFYAIVSALKHTRVITHLNKEFIRYFEHKALKELELCKMLVNVTYVVMNM